MIEPGQLVLGKLRIEKILGKGGMGVVVAATHVGLDQRVALKILHPEIANQPDVVARFVREARASAKLRSEHACRVTDVGELEGGQPYIEMELLEGRDLASRIAEAPLPIEIAAEYVAQACIAIAEAHGLGIVHRDLKPANLFLTQRLDGTPLVKVLDFGIATAPAAEEFKITKTTTVMGSPGYMSPEHLRSARDVDVRSDIWSLGVILYEAVSGRLPFQAQTITELAVKVVMDAPDPLPEIDPAFAAVIFRCLEKAPSQRYQSVAELSHDLAPFGGPSAHTSAMLIARLIGASRSQPVPAASASASAMALASSQQIASTAGFAQTVATRAHEVVGPGMAPPPGMTATMPPPGAMPTPVPVPPSQLPTSSALHMPSTQVPTQAQWTTAPPMPPPPRRRNRALIATGVALVVLAGAVFAFVLVSKEEEAGRRAHRREKAIADAGVVLSTPAPMPTPTDEKTESGPAQLREIQRLAAIKDWRGVLLLADDADDDDPAVQKLLTDAKASYIAEQTAAIREHAKSGDCAGAKLAASDGAKVLPDEEDAFDALAASCAQKSRSTAQLPPLPPTPPAPPSTAPGAGAPPPIPPIPSVAGDPGAAGIRTAQAVLDKLEKLDNLATDDYSKGEYKQAIETARQVLATAPTDANALGVAARAACAEHDMAGAKVMIDQLPASERAAVTAECTRENAAATADIAKVRASLLAKQWSAAESAARVVLKTQPKNREAWFALGVSACHLGHDSVLDEVYAKAPDLTKARVRRSCGQASHAHGRGGDHDDDEP